MRHFAFDKAVAFTLPFSIAGCTLLTPLDGLTGGVVDAGARATGDAGTGDPQAGEGCPSACGDAGPIPETTADAGSDASAPADIDAGGESNGSAPGDASPDVGAPDVGPPPVVDAGPCTPPTLPSLDVCVGFGALPAPPVIDGTLDCGVPLWSMPVVVASGPGPIPANIQAVIGAAWRPDGLYFFVSVSGAGPDRYPAPSSEVAWCGDAVELFVDQDGIFPNAPSYNDPGTAQLVAIAPPATDQVSTAGQVFRDGNELGPWNGQFISRATDDGFVTEAFITASDLGLASWSLSAGANVGLDVSVDLGSATDPGDGARLGQFTIQLPDYTPTGCAAGCDVGEFCVPQLE